MSLETLVMSAGDETVLTIASGKRDSRAIFARARATSQLFIALLQQQHHFARTTSPLPYSTAYIIPPPFPSVLAVSMSCQHLPSFARRFPVVSPFESC